MQRRLVSSLPHPLAHALLAFLDEDPPRSADELSELFVAVVEYVGAVAIADYLDGHTDPRRCAQDNSLNGWLVSQLARTRTRRVDSCPASPTGPLASQPTGQSWRADRPGWLAN